MATTPHASFRVPFAVANRLISLRLATLEPVSAGPLRMVPRALALVPARPGRVGMRLEIDVQVEMRTLFGATVELEVTPTLTRETATIEVSLGPGDVRAVTPHLGSGPAEALARELLSRLPPVTRGIVPSQDVARVVASGSDALGGRLLAALIDTGLLGRLGDVSQLRFQVPGPPIVSVDVTSVGGDHGSLDLGVTTALPVALGLTGAAPPVPADALVVRLSGSTVAELANWGLATGRLPGRYDDEMRARPDGAFVAGLGWAAGPRPLKLYAWKLGEPCLRLRVGATPHAELVGDRLKGGFDDGVIEEIVGTAAVRAVVWLRRLGKGAIRLAREVTARATLTIGGVPVETAVTSVRFAGDELVVTLSAAPPRP